MSSLLFMSTFVCFSGYVTPIFIKYLMTFIYSENKLDQSLRTELRKLEREMSGISVVNEFAKFTRLQRRHTKLKDELRNNASTRLSSKNKNQLFLFCGHKFVSIAVTLILVYLYGKEPVLILPKGLLWPFENFFSWPSIHDDAISLTTWMILTRLVVDACKQDIS